LILLLGGKGSIGRRYATILDEMEEDFEVYDLDEANLSKRIDPAVYDAAIVATPTETHSYYCRLMASIGVRFLCEKPLTKSYVEASNLVEDVKQMGGKGYVVNNWEFALANYDKLNTVTYSYFNTGKDGFVHDMCQLIHLANKHDFQLFMDTASSVWTVMVNGDVLPYRTLEMSYGAMLQAFLADDERVLWSLEEGLEMVKDVKVYEAGSWDHEFKNLQ
jgi:hypothetical protein